MRAFLLIGVLTAAFLGAEAQAKVVTQAVEYKHGDVVLEGYLAFDDAVTGKRPGVLVIHEWWGLNSYAKKRAEQLAALGYVAFAADMYGKGVTTTSADEAGKLAGRFKDDPALLRARAKAGLDVLARQTNVDPQRIAAIGYCFGGTTVLHLAAGGANLAGVVSFHGGLGGFKPDEFKGAKAKILVLHGADDPFIPAEQITVFQQALRDAKVDWEMIYYGGAVHSFTNPDAKGEIPGAKYDAAAERRSWEAVRQFFREIFREGGAGG